MKFTNRTRLVSIALILILALAASACSSNEEASGGSVTIGAEQEPDCLNFIGSCSGSSWGFWMVAVNTLPRAYSAERVGDEDKWEYKATSLLAKEAELETDPVQTIKYTISDDAVWSDGEPIVGQDFVFTWDQIANGSDVYDSTGYVDIDSVKVDPDNEKVVTVTMKKNYAAWKSFFGGNYGVLPEHLLKGKDLNDAMGSGYTFSGGPFKLTENGWEKGKSITLIPNDKYWGDKPKLDKVVFRFQADTTAEFTAYKAGEVLAIYPQPQMDVIDALNGESLEGEQIVNAVTGNTEALWINNDAAPFDEEGVRQALGYTIDRNEVVNSLFGEIGVKKAVNSFVPPVVSSYSDPKAFADYKPNSTKADALLTDAGYAKSSNGKWAKNGKLLSFEIHTTEGNERRKLTLENIQKQLNDEGWTVDLKFVPAGDLFGDLGPTGQFQVALYAQVLTTLDPSNCNLFCSVNIPTDENENTGNNWTHTNVKGADELLGKVDSSLSESSRAKASKAAEKLLAGAATSFPLDPLPNIFLWSDKLSGDIDENPIQGPFWTLNKWSLDEE